MARPFRLATVLKVRRIQEDMARQALAVANRDLVVAREDRDGRVDHYRALPAPEGMQLFHEFLHQEQTMLLAADSVAFGERKVTEAHAVAEGRRHEFLAARKKVRILERLEERRRLEEDIEESRRLAAAVDDIVTTRWAGRMAAGGTAPARDLAGVGR